MTDVSPAPPDPVEIAEVYQEAADQPVAGGRWEVLADNTVQYVRPSGDIVTPAVVPADTLRRSSTWRRVR